MKWMKMESFLGELYYWSSLLTWLTLKSHQHLSMHGKVPMKRAEISNSTLSVFIHFPPLCTLCWHIFPFQKGLLSFLGLCLGLQIVAFVNNVHKERLLNSCWVIFVLHFAPSVNTGTTPTPFPDEPNLAVKAENVTQLHPIFRTCNEEKM